MMFITVGLPVGIAESLTQFRGHRRRARVFRRRIL